MKSAPAFVTVCVLLGCSVLLNLVLLTRPRERERPGAPPSRAEPRPSSPREELPPPPSVPEPLRRAAPAPAAEVPVRASAGAPPRGLSVRDDPAVAAVIDAQAAFKAFWNDLDQLFRAKQRLDDQKVFQTALATTMDFLELPDGSRPGFVEAARAGVSGLVLARAEEDEAKKALPPKDKTNPAAAAAVDQQRKAIEARYRERVKAAVDGVNSRLDPQNPRHVEFASNVDKWLRNLVPRQP